jgi:hypothetical protein
MTLGALLIILGLIALLAILYFARSHGPRPDADALATQLRPIDVDAFLNLTDEREEQYLRERLQTAQFWRVQRQRKLAAIEYVWAAGKNAAILTRVAEAARTDPDAEIAAAGQQLLDSALKLRLYTLQTLPRLWIGVLIPQIPLSGGRVPEAYGQMHRKLVMLGCLDSPSREMSTAP